MGLPILVEVTRRRTWGITLLGLTALASVACGGSSTRNRAPNRESEPAGAAGQASAADNAGGTGQGGANVESGAAGTLATGGTITVITSEPAACKTADGRDGIIVDTFPYPSPVPRCEALNQSGTLDTACPEEPKVSCFFRECLIDEPLAGCCRADGSCGIWDTGRFGTQKSLGCISRDAWIENSAWLGGERQAVSCGAP